MALIFISGAVLYDAVFASAVRSLGAHLDPGRCSWLRVADRQDTLGCVGPPAAPGLRWLV